MAHNREPKENLVLAKNKIENINNYQRYLDNMEKSDKSEKGWSKLKIGQKGKLKKKLELEKSEKIGQKCKMTNIK